MSTRVLALAAKLNAEAFEKFEKERVAELEMERAVEGEGEEDEALIVILMTSSRSEADSTISTLA